MLKKKFKCPLWDTKSDAISRIVGPPNHKEQKIKCSVLYPKRRQKSLINKFLKLQLKQPNSRDWGTQVQIDIKELELNVEIEVIEIMTKNAFKILVKNKVKERAYTYLQKKK